MLGGGVSTNDPTKYAFPEDILISIKYGMYDIKAEKLLLLHVKDLT